MPKCLKKTSFAIFDVHMVKDWRTMWEKYTDTGLLSLVTLSVLGSGEEQQYKNHTFNIHVYLYASIQYLVEVLFSYHVSE